MSYILGTSVEGRGKLVVGGDRTRLLVDCRGPNKYRIHMTERSDGNISHGYSFKRTREKHAGCSEPQSFSPRSLHTYTTRDNHMTCRNQMEEKPAILFHSKDKHHAKVFHCPVIASINSSH